MGLFGSKKTYVSSVAYNMAGDELDRPNYLKTAVFGGIIMDNEFSVADMLRTAYLNGPGIKMRTFYNWALDNYGLIGVPTGFQSSTPETESISAVLAGIIEHEPSETVSVASVEIKLADYSYWADQWMLENHPDLIDTEWISDYDDDTGLIMVTFEDDTIETFTPVGFDRNSTYVYASYTVTRGEEDGPIVEGSVVTLVSGDPFPDVTSFTLDSDETTDHPVTLNTTTTVVSVYSDSRPDETNTSSSSSGSEYEEFHRVYSKILYQGFEDGGFFDYDRIYSEKQIQHHWQTGSITSSSSSSTAAPVDVGSGVTRTDTTTVVTESITLARSYREDTQEITLKSWSRKRVFIYEVGSGEPALDEFVTDDGDNGGYLPFIPIRLDNKFVSETYLPDVYALAKKAYKKATKGAKFDEIIEKIAENESLGDIDYAYLMYGVSLNVLDNSGRKYLYDFFHTIMEGQSTTRSDFDDWLVLDEFYQDSLAVWTEWQNAQEDPGGPLYGTPEPELLQSTPAPISEVRIRSTGTGGLDTNLNVAITWNSIEEQTGSGLKKPGARKGELWFEVVPGSVERIMLNWQVTETSWKALTITGMVHRNFIYDGKYVEIKSTEALNDDEETGFIVPLRYETLRQMSLIDSTQISTCCTFVVFNSYKVVKQKWYQTGIFKIIAVIVTIAISVTVGPQAALAFQAVLSVTTGFDGTLFGLIFGKGLSAILTLVIMKILSTVTEPIFGEKLGKAIATIGAIIIVSVGTSMAGGASFSEATKSTFSLSAQNILNMTSAVGQGIGVYVGIGTANIINSNQKLLDDYEKESKRISELYRQNFGFGDGVINPLLLTDASYVVIESEASFLERTLLTGSDISEMTMKLIKDFSAINLNINLPD